MVKNKRFINSHSYLQITFTFPPSEQQVFTFFFPIYGKNSEKVNKNIHYKIRYIPFVYLQNQVKVYLGSRSFLKINFTFSIVAGDFLNRKWYVHMVIYGKCKGLLIFWKNLYFFLRKINFTFFPLHGKKVKISTKYQ